MRGLLRLRGCGRIQVVRGGRGRSTRSGQTRMGEAGVPHGRGVARVLERGERGGRELRERHPVLVKHLGQLFCVVGFQTRNENFDRVSGEIS